MIEPKWKRYFLSIYFYLLTPLFSVMLCIGNIMNETNDIITYPDLTTYQIHRDLLIVSIRSFCCLKYRMKLKRWKVSFYSCRVYFKWQKTCNIVSYYTPCSFVIFLVIPKIFGEPFYAWMMVCQTAFDKQDFVKDAIFHKRR